jgi:hypothetical protein
VKRTGLPTAASSIQTRYDLLRVTCTNCLHQGYADLQHLVREDRGDVPLEELRWRCAACGSRWIDAVVEAHGAGGVGGSLLRNERTENRESISGRSGTGAVAPRRRIVMLSHVV